MSFPIGGSQHVPRKIIGILLPCTVCFPDACYPPPRVDCQAGRVPLPIGDGCHVSVCIICKLLHRPLGCCHAGAPPRQVVAKPRAVLLHDNPAHGIVDTVLRDNCARRRCRQTPARGIICIPDSLCKQSPIGVLLR